MGKKPRFMQNDRSGYQPMAPYQGSPNFMSGQRKVGRTRNNFQVQPQQGNGDYYRNYGQQSSYHPMQNNVINPRPLPFSHNTGYIPNFAPIPENQFVPIQVPSKNIRKNRRSLSKNRNNLKNPQNPQNNNNYNSRRNSAEHFGSNKSQP